MKVYAVIAGADYEGEDVSSLKLFVCRKDAEACAEDLELKLGYDYVVIVEQPVEENYKTTH